MITSIAFTGYAASDITRARRFYEHGLGFRPSHNFRDECVEYEVGGSPFAITTMDMGRSPGARECWSGLRPLTWTPL
jgi:catechol 2,3-dioxygenase-like lactoylglutathione lyase family enzyme